MNTDTLAKEDLLLTPLNMAALQQIPWTEFREDGWVVFEIDDTAMSAWGNLLSGDYSQVSLSSIIQNKTNEYIQSCLFSLFLEDRIWYDLFYLELASWSADVAYKVDAILSMNNTSYAIDFTSNLQSLGTKLNDRSPKNRSNWVVLFRIGFMKQYIQQLLKTYQWDYSQDSIIRHMRDQKRARMNYPDIRVYDKRTKSLPNILKPQDIQYI